MNTIEINGREYEVTGNYLFAKEINGDYDGYSIKCSVNGYKTMIYKINKGFYAEKEPQLIGTVCYDYETGRMVLYKFVNDEEHLFLKADSYGINNEIMKHLRTSDTIFISNGKNNYTISVRKALQVGEYLKFGGFELQFFIPVSEFKCTEIKKKRKKRNVRNK